MPGTFSPTADFKGNRWLAIPACITARAWRTCRDACRDRLPVVTGKTFPAFPAHAHPQICVSGKRPMKHSRVCETNLHACVWEVKIEQHCTTVVTQVLFQFTGVKQCIFHWFISYGIAQTEIVLNSSLSHHFILIPYISYEIIFTVSLPKVINIVLL